MPISIVGTGSITGLSAGGLPDNSIVTADIADSAVTTGKLAQPLTLATAQNSTSGTAIDFTGIPSWAKRITVMFNGVSTSGTSHKLIQLGSGSITNTGYVATGWYGGTTSGVVSYTSGFPIISGQGSDTLSGNAFFNTIGNNIWVGSLITKGATDYVEIGGGNISLSGTLDRLRITTVNGTDTFDAGSINIMYEG